MREKSYIYNFLQKTRRESTFQNISNNFMQKTAIDFLKGFWKISKPQKSSQVRLFLIFSIIPVDAHAHLGNIWGGGEWANGVALPPQSLFVFRL